MIAIAYCYISGVDTNSAWCHMVIIVDMHMHALQFINFTKFNFKKTQLLVFQKDPVAR